MGTGRNEHHADRPEACLAAPTPSREPGRDPCRDQCPGSPDPVRGTRPEPPAQPGDEHRGRSCQRAPARPGRRRLGEAYAAGRPGLAEQRGRGGRHPAGHRHLARSRLRALAGPGPRGRDLGVAPRGRQHHRRARADRRRPDPGPRARPVRRGGQQPVLRQPVPRPDPGRHRGPRGGAGGAAEHARPAGALGRRRLAGPWRALGDGRAPAGGADRGRAGVVGPRQARPALDAAAARARPGRGAGRGRGARARRDPPHRVLRPGPAGPPGRDRPGRRTPRRDRRPRCAHRAPVRDCRRGGGPRRRARRPGVAAGRLARPVLRPAHRGRPAGPRPRRRPGIDRARRRRDADDLAYRARRGGHHGPRARGAAPPRPDPAHGRHPHPRPRQRDDDRLDERHVPLAGHRRPRGPRSPADRPPQLPRAVPRPGPARAGARQRRRGLAAARRAERVVQRPGCLRVVVRRSRREADRGRVPCSGGAARDHPRRPGPARSRDAAARHPGHGFRRRPGA